jgi:ribonuclease D
MQQQNQSQSKIQVKVPFPQQGKQQARIQVPLQAVQVTYVDTEDKLVQAFKEWNSCSELGIDIECENNLHHYGAYISIVQISSKDKNWVVDIINLKNVPLLVQILENKNIIKIFHDVSFDFRILQHQLNCKPKNVFDTQVAALLLGKKDIGLGALLQEYFNVKKEAKFQMADWTKRPLTPEMLSYAVKDTNKLIDLKRILMDEIISKNRLSWIEEECALIEKTDYLYKEGDFFDVKGINKLSNSERAVLKKMFDIREFLAKKVNRPVHFIISTSKMVEFAKNNPSLNDWLNMKGVHPIVRVKAKLFYEEILKAKKTEIPLPKLGARKFYTQPQKDEFERYNQIRDVLSERLGLEKHMILSKDQIRDIVVTGKMDTLSNWQKVLVMAELKK